MSMRIIEYFPFLVLFALAKADMDLKALSSSVAQFSAKFCNELDKTKSVVSSPLSAEFVLALLTLGTTDTAHEELLTSLGFPNDDAIRSSFSSLSTKLKAIKGVTLNVANKVYIKEGAYELVKELEEDAVKVFDAAIEKINFGDSAAAANLINKWVEQKTNEKIKDLLSPDSVNDDTRLVLVNALYFKGSWKKKFDARATRDQPFYLNADTKVDVPMMYKEDDYKYGQSEELNAQLLEIPYEGESASMLIVLPNDITGLDGVLQKLADGYDLMTELDKMWSTKVQVTMPKFKIETEIDLMSVLPKLGIKAIFYSSNSGLTKILNNNESLYVSKAVQKAFIEVNEEGAEAAAATAFVVECRCLVLPEEFIADHPFFYLLMEENRTPIFIVMAVRKKRAISSPRAFAVDRPALWCVMAARTPVFALVPRFRPTTHARTEL